MVSVGDPQGHGAAGDDRSAGGASLFLRPRASRRRETRHRAGRLSARWCAGHDARHRHPRRRLAGGSRRRRVSGGRPGGQQPADDADWHLAAGERIRRDDHARTRPAGLRSLSLRPGRRARRCRRSARLGRRAARTCICVISISSGATLERTSVLGRASASICVKNGVHSSVARAGAAEEMWDLRAARPARPADGACCSRLDGTRPDALTVARRAARA